MAGNRIKLFSGISAVGLEKKINEWLSGEGAKHQINGTNTAMCDNPKADGQGGEQKITVALWYTEK